MNILLIEDNESITKALSYFLSEHNFNLTISSSYVETLNKINSSYNLLIMDITLPDGNGVDLYQRLKEEYDIPTIFLTAKDDEETIVKCFNLGADDYLTKPFRSLELLARINKIFQSKNSNHIIKVQNIKLDLDKMLVYQDDAILNLTPLELKILILFFQNVNHVISRQNLLNKIWEWTGNDVNDNTVTVYLKRLRSKLNRNLIITIKGIGYRVDQND